MSQAQYIPLPDGLLVCLLHPVKVGPVTFVVYEFFNVKSGSTAFVASKKKKRHSLLEISKKISPVLRSFAASEL